MPSVMQKIVVMPAARPPSRRPARRPAGTKMQDVFGAGLADRVGDGVEHRDRAVQRGLAALAGVMPATTCVP